MERNETLQQKLKSLIEIGKKEGKITSKQLLNTLDAIDADEKQTEQIYDALEKAGIEIDVSDVAEILSAADDLLPEPMATPIAFGSDTFKTWEDVIAYFERLGGQ